MKLFITHISCHTLCDRPTWLSIIEMGLLLLDMYVVYQSKTLPGGNSFLKVQQCYCNIKHEKPNIMLLLM